MKTDRNSMSESPAAGLLVIKGLALRGWSKIRFSDPSEATLRREMRSLAAGLGEPIPVRTKGDIFSTLAPVASEAAHPNSLSHKFALGEFELHNDTAHWIRPCRFILLACVESGGGGRPSLILDTRRLSLKHEQHDLLHTAPVRITNGRKSFFSTILSRGRDFVRFDPGCMTGTTEASLAALEILKKRNWPDEVEEFQWTPGIGLVIDNWRILHGRGSAFTEDSGRKLLRISLL